MVTAYQAEEEALGKAYDSRLMRRLLRYVRPHRVRVVLAVAVLLVVSLLELVGPWLTKVVLDQAIPQKDLQLLGMLALAYLGSLLLDFIFEYIQTIITTWLGQRIMFDLRREIFAHLQRQSLRYFDRNPVGRLMTRVTNDVEVLNDLFSSGIVTVFGDVFTLLFIIGIMLYMDWKLALAAFVVMPFVALVAFLFRAFVRDAYRDIRVRLARINAFMQERLTGVAVVQLFGREEATSLRFRDINRDYLDAHLRSITYYALFFPLIELLTAVALALIIYYGGLRMIAGDVTVGVVAAFLMYSRRFFRPIQDLSEKYNMLQGAMASSERIFKLLDSPIEVGEPEAPVSLPEPGRGEIEFRNVWFAYQNKDDGEPDWVLRDVSFTARPGERIAIVGHTGAGKTSLVNLLMRFYEPQRGEILFDGVPIDRVATAALRARIGLVLQDIFLFSRDVKYNIRLGNDDISDARIREAAERIGAAPYIERLARGYDDPVGERGTSLSVGERQLLAFARALAFDPLVLVLDEATSSVDSQLETQIEHAANTLLHGRTSLVIAHRLSTVQTADRILVLHHGELREHGTHQELLARGGLYARLYELQFARNAPTGTTG
ncbi:MAG TPA: ABC transporter ATP-binding protein [Longimicrobiales bacterium]|nr:ABC transporter ATP-binding protein [Longimicrobiales bacterium]